MLKLIIPGKMPCLNDYIDAERSSRYLAASMKRLQSERVSLYSSSQLARVALSRPVVMHYTWYEPNRRRDKDNISSFGRKVIQDALVKSGVLKNDGWAQIESFSDSFKVDKENPRIEVEIFEIDADPTNRKKVVK